MKKKTSSKFNSERFKNCIQKKHTIENPDFFDIYQIFNDYIADHYKNFEFFLVKYDVTLVLDKQFHPQNKSELRIIHSKTHLKKILLL